MEHKKMKILVISEYSGTNNKGGASKSIVNIVNSLKDVENIQIKVLTQKFQNKLLRSVALDPYLSIPSIVKSILKFKPDVVITQSGIAFPTILVCILKKIPVIHIIRSTVDFCPKYVDITGYGKACLGIKDRKTCFKCINEWKTLRILIGNRSKGTEYSIRTSLVSILYKLRYFICSFHLYLIERANINVVASKLMVEYFSNKIDRNKFKITNMTPIQKQKIIIQPKITGLLFVRTDYETSHKGFDFIKRISKLIPKQYIIVVGGSDSIEEEGYPNIINLSYISSKQEFFELLSKCLITLVPTFCTEAFGRVIPESLANRIPVISSPQCGANQFFEHKKFLKVVPLKLDLWIKAIEDIIQNPYVITNYDISQIYEQFSLEKSKKDFIKVIREVLIN